MWALFKDCKSSSSVAEYLILNVLLMVEARLRSDSNWELNWRPVKNDKITSVWITPDAEIEQVVT